MSKKGRERAERKRRSQRRREQKQRRKKRREPKAPKKPLEPVPFRAKLIAAAIFSLIGTLICYALGTIVLLGIGLYRGEVLKTFADSGKDALIVGCLLPTLVSVGAVFDIKIPRTTWYNRY